MNSFLKYTTFRLLQEFESAYCNNLVMWLFSIENVKIVIQNP